MAGELYRAWASEGSRRQSIAATLKPGRKGKDRDDWVVEHWVSPEEEAGGFHAIAKKLDRLELQARLDQAWLLKVWTV